MGVATQGLDGLPSVSYDFSQSHVGDRGVVCVLHAIAMDPRCSALSLRSCGLRSSSGGCIAAFAELHPRIAFLDLSHNCFSFESGELLLEALNRRSRRNTSEVPTGLPSAPPHQPDSPRHLGQKLPRVVVDVGGTALAWDRGGFTVGPPSGNMWAGLSDSRARFAPSEYEKLRGRLDESCKFGYDRYDRSPSPMPELQVPWRACGDAQNNMASFLPQLAPVPS